MSEIIESKPQLPPGFCFICELSNDVRYVDTFRDFEGVVRERLDGRKYVCEECVSEFAQKLGFVSPKKYDELHKKVSDLTADINRLEVELKKHADLEAALAAFGINAKPTPKAPVKKPAAAKAS